jgi:hypothetical protein
MGSVKLGGERLGSGKKSTYVTKTFERSTHNLSYLWRSSMSAGTLVPFMSEVALPGDTFDLELNVDVKTLPTIGPLFGSYKVQLDVFEVPVRLFNGKLHMNKLNLGREMNQVFLPQMLMKHNAKIGDIQEDNSQINSSSIYSYLNIRGLGVAITDTGAPEDRAIERKFNALPLLGYWSIFKNYYANKQEVNAKVIHASEKTTDIDVVTASLSGDNLNNGWREGKANSIMNLKSAYEEEFIGTIDGNRNLIRVADDSSGSNQVNYTLNELFGSVEQSTDAAANNVWSYVGLKETFIGKWLNIDIGAYKNTIDDRRGVITLKDFPLENIDDMTMDILSDVRGTDAFEINDVTSSPYGLGLAEMPSGVRAQIFSQEGLAVKTYQSDKFNNWINLEFIEGPNGVSEVTAVDTSAGSFTIDALSLANKVYKMLNRINMSGGSYNDWIDAVYSHDSVRKTESPIYHGSLIRELAFEEVISTAEAGADEQPLGTLAGKGALTGKNKGGKMVIKTHEPGYIMGIVSLTPRVDYSQGNKWDTNLKTLDDFHKPDLDQIGFQDLITDEMAWFDTFIDDTNTIEYGTAGKVPAWLNYMTNVNQTRGNFAEQNKEMFMTLNRKYSPKVEGLNTGISDLTTYIDPAKFNNIFADTSLDSQNFWTQISVKNTARRKMSAKVIPNL